MHFDIWLLVEMVFCAIFCQIVHIIVHKSNIKRVRLYTKRIRRALIFLFKGKYG